MIRTCTVGFLLLLPTTVTTESTVSGQCYDDFMVLR
jgi:hypothetical protein